MAHFPEQDSLPSFVYLALDLLVLRPGTLCQQIAFSSDLPPSPMTLLLIHVYTADNSEPRCADPHSAVSPSRLPPAQLPPPGLISDRSGCAAGDASAVPALEMSAVIRWCVKKPLSFVC